jgi:hypothetical protein
MHLQMIIFLLRTCFFICQFLLSTGWDLFVDWDLFHGFKSLLPFTFGLDKISFSVSHFFLRSDRIYSWTGFYFSAIAFNIFVRLLPLIRFLIHFNLVHLNSNDPSTYTSTFYMICIDSPFLYQVLEILRRWVWSFIRIEVQELRSNKSVNRPLLMKNMEEKE